MDNQGEVKKSCGNCNLFEPDSKKSQHPNRRGDCFWGTNEYTPMVFGMFRKPRAGDDATNCECWEPIVKPDDQETRKRGWDERY